MDLTQQISIILVVFIVLGAMLWLLRAKGMAQFSFGPPGGGARRLQVVERLTLTPQHSVHLIQVDGRQLLIGVSPAGCQFITPVTGKIGEAAR